MIPAIPASKLKTSISWETAGVSVLLLLGAVLRLRQYFTGRSLWVDEAMLALNIVERGFTGMFQPLDYDQGAPVGFLLVEKIFNSVLGMNEFALRLFPLLAGLISLFLFYFLLRRVTHTAGLLTALALFAFNPRLVYYSSEVKQYIVDVAVTIFLLWIAAPVFRPAPQKKDFAWLIAAGLIALWLSHPALFVLAGIGLALMITALKRRDYLNLRWIMGMGMLWILNIGFLYLLILKDLSQNAYMREYWEGAFLPLPPWSDPGWFLRAIDNTIRLQFGMPYATLFVFALMLVGWVVLLLRNREYAVIFACILLVTLIASGLQLYPVFDRMALFLVPIGLALLGKTTEALQRGLERYTLRGTLSVLLLAGYLLYGPLVTSFQSFLEPKYFEHIRPTMEHLRESWKGGDALYVSHGALPAFRYYASFYGLEGIQYEFGRREDYKAPENILMRLEQFQERPRVWILFSHVYEKENFNEREFVLEYLDQTGDKRREFRVPGTSVFLYLYDLEN
ncbi:MAG TPA: glycosyltransferase family 39 protein [Anaerolineales bacterium]|nr:glycosyltransferase family 39 protein [Anaerolineales bacterium]